MNTPIIILLVLQVLSVGINMAKHGEPKTGKYNFFTSLISMAIVWTLFYYAGIFELLTQ